MKPLYKHDCALCALRGQHTDKHYTYDVYTCGGEFVIRFSDKPEDYEVVRSGERMATIKGEMKNV